MHCFDRASDKTHNPTMSVRVLKQLTVEKVETPHDAFRPETLFTADVQNNV